MIVGMGAGHAGWAVPGAKVAGTPSRLSKFPVPVQTPFTCNLIVSETKNLGLHQLRQLSGWLGAGMGEVGPREETATLLPDFSTVPSSSRRGKLQIF